MCLYGHDLDEDTTPIEAGLTWVIGEWLCLLYVSCALNPIFRAKVNNVEKREASLASKVCENIL